MKYCTSKRVTTPYLCPNGTVRACPFGIHSERITSFESYTLKLVIFEKKNVIDFLAKLDHFKSFGTKSKNDEFESY